MSVRAPISCVVEFSSNARGSGDSRHRRLGPLPGLLPHLGI